MTRTGPLSDRTALTLLIGGLTVANVARSTVVPRRWHLPYNVAMATYAVAVARLGGLTTEELGLSRARAGDGARVGAVAFGAISAIVAVGAVAGLLEDDRTDVPAADMVVRALVVIPLGTVVAEELSFRGALHGLLSRVTGPRPALVVGSVLFGLWHVAPVWSQGPATVAGTAVATTFAGAGFVWLRRRSGSVLAPMLAHLGTNSTTFALSWATS